MRVSEKTIELNFCAQASAAVAGGRLIWFGLTQKQEAQFGFDACTKLHGRLFLFQFKASNFVLKTGARRFSASHTQMLRLQTHCQARRGVFYVFPMVGTTLELAKTPDLLSASYLLDVAGLPLPMPAPTKQDGSLRKSEVHYVNVYAAGHAIIHSEPRRAEVIAPRSFFQQGLPDAEGLLPEFDGQFGRFWEFRQSFGRNAVGLIVVAE